MMSVVLRLFISLFLLIPLQLSFSFTTEAEFEPVHLGHFCFNTTTLPENKKTFQDNLKSLLDDFSFYAEFTSEYSDSNTWREGPDTVYGLFSCRSSLQQDSCQSCVNFATRDVTQRCPRENQAVIWYHNCLLIYSTLSNFSSTLMESPIVNFTNPQNVSDPTAWDDFMETGPAEMMTDLVARAASANGRFSITEVSSSSNLILYVIMQCTPLLSSTECKKCLEVAVAQLPSCCRGKIGGRVMIPSCYVRYENYSLFDPDVISEPPTRAPTPIQPRTRAPTPPAALLLLRKPKEESKLKRILVVGISTAVLGIVLLSTFAFIIFRRRRNISNSKDILPPDFGGVKFGNDEFTNEEIQHQNMEGSQEFPSIQLDIINAATNHFSDANKLGQGGFGPVYKGILADGKEIAVKRLSTTSSQGILEFKNEIILIARLQHRNLVRLLGGCLEGDEKLLVYEYMPNRSLDVFLFDGALSIQLNWQRRFSIIRGIARGILYLHEDSRLRIIHRDLKASNILLDSEMNPKISDFGLARIFGGNQCEASTNRVVGTYGYMAPEYAMQGFFSVKSDVFSFGVLLLEIIIGKKNNGLFFYELGESLLTFAWKLWSDDQGLELIDKVLVQTCVQSEVLKCIHIGLLCVQKDPAHRPTMSSVIHMLVSEAITLPKPTEPAFFVGGVSKQELLPSRDKIVNSINEVTLSSMEPR